MTSVSCKSLHVGPTVEQFVSDPVSIIACQNGCDQGPAISSVFNLMEMTEVEYTHLYYIIQSHMDVPTAEQEFLQIHLCKNMISSPFNLECNLSNHPESKRSCSPSPSSVTCQHSTSSMLSTVELFTFPDLNYNRPEEVHNIELVLCNSNDGEKTPTTCVEVPNSVLAKARFAKDSSVDLSDRRTVLPLHLRPIPPARVCLEKRFNCRPSDITRQPETQAAVLNTLLSLLNSSTEAQGIAAFSQSENCPKAKRVAAGECAHSKEGTISNTYIQGLGSLLEGIEHPEVVLPQNFSFSFRPDKETELMLKTPYIQVEAEEKDTADQQNVAKRKSCPPTKLGRVHGPRALQEQDPNIIHGPGSWEQDGKLSRRKGPPIEVSQSRERHNSRERDRRKRIRLCCDELNLLVPFCSPETDKATTLQWTTAFLKYIREVYGDSLKQEFESTFCGETGVRLKPSSVTVVQNITENRT